MPSARGREQEAAPFRPPSSYQRRAGVINRDPADREDRTAPRSRSYGRDSPWSVRAPRQNRAGQRHAPLDPRRHNETRGHLAPRGLERLKRRSSRRRHYQATSSSARGEAGSTSATRARPDRDFDPFRTLRSQECDHLTRRTRHPAYRGFRSSLAERASSSRWSRCHTALPTR